MINRKGIYEAGVSMSVFFYNRKVEIKNIPKLLKKTSKLVKRRFYGRVVNRWKIRIDKHHKKYQSKLDAMFDKKTLVLNKFYENGGEYQLTQNVEIKICGEL